MRYLLGLLGVVGLIIVVVVLIIRGFGGDEPQKTGRALTDYTHTNVVMRFTAEAPVNADAIHQAVRVTVGRNEAKAEILQGYDDIVANTVSYPNNTEAYGVFLRALDLLNFDRGSEEASLQDERGVCPDGNLFLMEIFEDSRRVQRYWQTSCGEGNFGGELGLIEELFQAQIPDFGNFTRDVNL